MVQNPPEMTLVTPRLPQHVLCSPWSQTAGNHEAKPRGNRIEVTLAMCWIRWTDDQNWRGQGAKIDDNFKAAVSRDETASRHIWPHRVLF